MEKTLKYLLMVVATVSVLGVYAQSLAKQPEPQMHSTSVMVGSGSVLPQAATTGTVVTGSTPGTYSPADGHHGHIRKIGGNTEGGPNDREDPYKDPIGDVFWPLMLLAGLYLIILIIRVVRARKRAREVRVVNKTK